MQTMSVDSFGPVLALQLQRYSIQRNHKKEVVVVKNEGQVTIPDQLDLDRLCGVSMIPKPR